MESRRHKDEGVSSLSVTRGDQSGACGWKKWTKSSAAASIRQPTHAHAPAQVGSWERAGACMRDVQQGERLGERAQGMQLGRARGLRAAGEELGRGWAAGAREVGECERWARMRACGGGAGPRGTWRGERGCSWAARGWAGQATGKTRAGPREKKRRARGPQGGRGAGLVGQGGELG